MTGMEITPSFPLITRDDLVRFTVLILFFLLV